MKGALYELTAKALMNLGIAYQSSGKSAQSMEALRQLIAFAPDTAFATEGRYNLAIALMKSTDDCLAAVNRSEAVVIFRQVLARDPRHAGAHSNLGTLLREAGQLDEALAHYRSAAELNSKMAEPFNNLAGILAETGDFVGAIANYERAIALTPVGGDSHNSSLHDVAHSNLLVTLHYPASGDPQRIFQEHLRYSQLHCANVKPFTQHVNNRKAYFVRLRIGYVSPDFRTHSVSYFFEPILNAHNRSEFEIFLYF